MPGTLVDYRDGETTCEAYVAGGGGARKPCVLVAHTWAGQTHAEQESADRFADLGYVGIAVDVYGKGRRGEHGTPTAMATNTALMMPFREDRAMLLRRLAAAVEFARSRDDVDPGRIAFIGYCFGGMCALDVARGNVPGVVGAVSIHGVYAAPDIGAQAPIKASILVAHGWGDPMAPPDDVVGLAKELTDAKADWQLHAYGNAMHAFTNPAANMPERGLAYNEKATQRSWQAIENFLGEILV